MRRRWFLGQQATKMRFGERLRQLRQAKGFTLRDLAAMVGVGYSYLSRCETGTLAFADYPGEELILKLAAALDGDPDELLIMAKKIPPQIRERVLQRPDAFRKLARLDDDALDRVLQDVEGTPPNTPARKRKAARRR
jgi:transcriptional regulator with XRE-family HTH domain